MFKKLCLIMTLIISVSVFACDKTPVFTSHKKAITVTQKNPTFDIVLKSNASTGYSWGIQKIDDKILKNTGHSYVAPKTKLVGAPGYEVWTFEALYPQEGFRVAQTGHIVMKYKKPWMKNEKNVTVKHFKIVLKK